MKVIAEIGINHNGNLDLALEMIKAAKESGANVVKFQKRNPDICVPEDQKNKIRVFQGKEMTYLDYKKLLEFGKEEYDIINQYCSDIHIQWTTSVWDLDSYNFMKQYFKDIPFIKLPSACITNQQLLNACWLNTIPIVISTGMSTIEEIDNAVKALKSNCVGILQCNSSYPSSENELDINVIQTLKIWYPHIKIGYSGHEKGFFPTLVAAAAGAEIVERHFTLDKNMEGTDQKASLEPEEFKIMVDQIKRIEAIKGSYIPKVYPSEELVKQKLRIR